MNLDRLRTIFSRFFPATTLLAILAIVSAAHAAPVTYYGLDAGAGPNDPRPNSQKAATDFLSATNSTGVVTFEQFASNTPFAAMNIPDQPGSLAVGPGVSLSSSPAETQGQSIGSPGSRSGLSTGNPSFLNPSAGYNTTTAGQVFLFMDAPEIGDTDTFGGYWQYTFSTPISAFGAFITGWKSDGQNSLFFEFNDGANQSLSFTGDATDSAQFFGFTDPGASITSVIVRQAGGSVWSMDDVIYGAAVPEPSTFALAACGALAMLAGALRYSKRAR